MVLYKIHMFGMHTDYLHYVHISVSHKFTCSSTCAFTVSCTNSEIAFLRL